MPPMNDRPEQDIPFAGLKSARMEKYNIFLVEDDPDDRMLALKTLRESPYIQDIHCFKTGDRLMQHFVSEGYYSGNLMRYIPSIVLLDIHLPGTSGIDILRQLKEHQVTLDIPVIVITADESHALAEQARRLKANGFISKPLNLEQIHQVIMTGWGWPHGLPPGP